MRPIHIYRSVVTGGREVLFHIVESLFFTHCNDADDDGILLCGVCPARRRPSRAPSIQRFHLLQDRRPTIQRARLILFRPESDPPFDPRTRIHPPPLRINQLIKSSDRAGDARPRGLHEREEPALASGVIDEQVVRHPRGGVRADAQQRDAKRLEDYAPRRRHEKNRE